MYDTPSIKYIYIRMYDTPSIKYIYIYIHMYAGFMGSMVSIKNLKFLNPEGESGGATEATLNAMKKRQMFTQTGI